MPRVELCSEAGAGNNEDLVAVHENGNVTDIFVLDGATSVAECNYVDNQQGDVTWFVRYFAAELGKIFAPDSSQESMVLRAAAATCSEWRDRTEGSPAPPYAWPIAALTWIRAIPGAEATVIHVYSLGDCKTLIREPDGTVRDLDPWTNPQEAILQREIAAMVAEGVTESAQRLARLMPLLRKRREEQNSALAPAVVCMSPGGPFSARKAVLQVKAGAVLLCMTDGFYRLVDPYDLYSPGQLIDACSLRGLAPLLLELRNVEGSSSTKGLTVKAADDASAVMWTA